jgi:hypothetical protein
MKNALLETLSLGICLHHSFFHAYSDSDFPASQPYWLTVISTAAAML